MKIKIKTKVLFTDAGQISYDDTGEKISLNGNDSRQLPVVICIPCAGDTRTQYRYVLKHLSKEGFRAISFDIRGMGNSIGHWKTCTINDVEDDLVHILHALKCVKQRGAIIIAHGESCVAAIQAASRETTLVKKIALISPVFGPSKYLGRLKRLSRFGTTMSYQVKGWIKYYESLYGKCQEDLPSDHYEYIRMLKHQMKDRKRFNRFIQLLKSIPCLDDVNLRKIRCPIYIAYPGIQKSCFDEKTIEYIQNSVSYSVPTIEVKKYTDCGHFIHVEDPSTFSEQIYNWMLQDDYVYEDHKTWMEVQRLWDDLSDSRLSISENDDVTTIIEKVKKENERIRQDIEALRIESEEMTSDEGRIEDVIEEVDMNVLEEANSHDEIMVQLEDEPLDELKNPIPEITAV